MPIGCFVESVKQAPTSLGNIANTISEVQSQANMRAANETKLNAFVSNTNEEKTKGRTIAIIIAVVLLIVIMMLLWRTS